MTRRGRGKAHAPVLLWRHYRRKRQDHGKLVKTFVSSPQTVESHERCREEKKGRHKGSAGDRVRVWADVVVVRVFVGGGISRPQGRTQAPGRSLSLPRTLA